MILQRARPEQIEAIRGLELEAFGHTWDEATFVKELSRPNGLTVVAVAEEQVAGSALLVWGGDEVQLNSIVLAPRFRGRGLSTQFLGRLLAWCQSGGFGWVTLEVKWRNPPAYRLYKSFGFVTTARRPRYYRDGQDARIMWAGHLRSPAYRRSLSGYHGEGRLIS